MGARPGSVAKYWTELRISPDQLGDGRLHRALGRLHLGRGLAETALDPFGVDERKVESRGHRGGGGIAAGADGPDELGTAVLMDDDDGQAGPDGHDGLGPLGRDRRVAQGPHQRRRDEVDPFDDEAGLLGRAPPRRRPGRDGRRRPGPAASSCRRARCCRRGPARRGWSCRAGRG